MSDDITEITPKHIEDYIAETYEGVNRISEASSGVIFEAFCECIVEQNSEYKIENLSEEWIESGMSQTGFAEMKFEEIVSDELHSVLTLEHRNQWIESCCDGIVEHKYIHNDG